MGEIKQKEEKSVMKIGKMEIKLLILDECYLEGKKNQLNNCYNGNKTKW